jgi:hypothetical protein
MMTLVSRRYVGTAAGTLMQASVAFCAKSLDPVYGTSFKLRVILVLPSAHDILQGANLPEATQFLLGGDSEKFTPAALSDQTVDLGNKGLRNDDVCALCAQG